MKSVDREQLFTSLTARVAYLHDFLEFGPADIKALAASRPAVNAAIPDVVDKVYAKLLEHDVTARVFSSRDSRSTDDPEEWPTLSGKEISRRKIFLRWYLKKLNSDPTAKGYWQYLDKVASMHVGRHRHAPVHVDYIFLGACLGYVHNILLQAIFSLDTIEVSKRLAIAQAWGKIVWIQNDFFARWQIRSSEGTVPDNASQMIGSTGCAFFDDTSHIEKSSEDGETAPPLSRTASTINSRSTSRSGTHRPVASYKLMRISQHTGKDTCPRLGCDVQSLIAKAKIVHREELNDGSVELLGTEGCLEALRDVIQRSGHPVTVDWDYDIWKHSADTEMYFGRETAQTLHENWTLARLQRLASNPSTVGRYYRYLLEQRSVRPINVKQVDRIGQGLSHDRGIRVALR